MAETVNTLVRLPEYMREANRSLFEPRVVSIGPYHRAKKSTHMDEAHKEGHRANKSTHDMEAHKERLVQAFFDRQGNENREFYVEEITAHCFAQALHWYGGDVGGYTANMLMLDGCFIVELLLLQWEDKARADNYIRIMWNSIYYDLLLVDNQIPFFVVERIFRRFRSRNENPAFDNTQLLHLVTRFFNPINREGQFSWAPAKLAPDVLPAAAANQVRHLLDVQHRLAVWNTGTEPTATLNCSRCVDICGRGRASTMPRGIPAANELQDYGVRFLVDDATPSEKSKIFDGKIRGDGDLVDKSEQRKIFDVKFEGNGAMTIPRFEINFGSKILLANLFAYEQIVRQPCDKHGAVTSYIALMNALINTADDVMVLQRAGILDNLLSSEKEVASFFNGLGRCTMLDMREHRYSGMFQDVNKYWMSHLNFSKYLAIFRLKHLRNPWTCISLLGAILLVIFSFTSMIIAILNFVKYKRLL
ncbi:hypothetical protein ABZP36_026866 [Zizania latifolia]